MKRRNCWQPEVGTFKCLICLFLLFCLQEPFEGICRFFTLLYAATQLIKDFFPEELAPKTSLYNVGFPNQTVVVTRMFLKLAKRMQSGKVL